jgi:hypothetical protein
VGVIKSGRSEESKLSSVELAPIVQYILENSKKKKSKSRAKSSSATASPKPSGPKKQKKKKKKTQEALSKSSAESEENKFLPDSVVGQASTPTTMKALSPSSVFAKPFDPRDSEEIKSGGSASLPQFPPKDDRLPKKKNKKKKWIPKEQKPVQS